MPHNPLKVCSGATNLIVGTLSWHCHHKFSIPQAELGTVRRTFRFVLIHPIYATIQNASKRHQTSSSLQPPVTLLSYQRRCGMFPLAHVRFGIPPLSPSLPTSNKIFALIISTLPFHLYCFTTKWEKYPQSTPAI